jgi:hypothetical protein
MLRLHHNEEKAMFQIPPQPETLTCPYCEKVIPYDDRLFIDHDWTCEDGTEDHDWTECCEECFDKYA